MIFKRFFFGGVHPQGNKNTHYYPAVRLDNFATVEILLQQHIGPACKALVKKGDSVEVGQIIADNDHPMAVPIHSSVSGIVQDVKPVLSATGVPIEAVIIQSDGKYTISATCVPPVIHSKEDFIQTIRNSGLVGLGGASFPTHIKLNPPKDKKPDILLINAAECEPYISSDYRQICERPDEIIDGILEIMKWTSVQKAIIGVENNKPSAPDILLKGIERRQLQSKSDTNCHQIFVKALPTIYPQGAEKMLIFALTGRQVPAGGLPHDANVIMLNISTARFIGKYKKDGMPLVRKRITLDGSALKIPGNANVPIGARISDVIQAAGGTIEEPSKIIMGGAMMGVALDRIDCGIIKANNAILVFGSKEAKVPSESPCIKCGRCISVCPMKLMPTGIDLGTRRQDIEDLEYYRVMDCIECGCCTYSCPAKRYLTQSIRNGKTLIKAEKDRQRLENQRQEEILLQSTKEASTN